MAPEVLQKLKYSQKADVFSFGIVLCEVKVEQPRSCPLSVVRVRVNKNVRLCFLQRYT